jgi:hypothetical protein
VPLPRQNEDIVIPPATPERGDAIGAPGGNRIIDPDRGGRS